jgi:hypothetical protein
MTDHCHGNDNDRMENDNAISEPATPHPALSRKGRGNCHDKNNISFWIATGRQSAPRNDGKNHGYDNGKQVAFTMTDYGNNDK